MNLKQVPLLIAVVFISVFNFAGTAFASTDDSSLIKGFAQYQAGRVENIALDSFILRRT